MPLATALGEWGRIGCIGFGGPPAHIRLLRQLCVERRGWLGGSEFEGAIAVCNLMPGRPPPSWSSSAPSGVPAPSSAAPRSSVPGLIVVLALSVLFVAGSPPLWVLGAGAGAGRRHQRRCRASSASGTVTCTTPRTSPPFSRPPQPVERYFSSGADRGSIIGNPLAEFLWGAGGLVHAWPANPGENQYTSVQNSNVPTLLIGGTLDFETPAQNATTELLPHHPNGHQVILSGLGHVDDFESYEPSASTQLLTTFYATGRVDTSRYTPNRVSFTPPATQTSIARDIRGTALVVVLAAPWLLWVRRHG